MFRRVALACGLAALLAGAATAYDNGLARLPIMGWNTWCTDDLCGLIDKCSEDLVKSVAKSMVDQGMDKLGYRYVNMDDCWSHTERTADGQLQPDPDRFPNGMKALADYVHSLGLRLGLYTCVGTLTCRGGRPGSYGYYERDAQTFKEWGIDFVKADNCHRPSGVSGRELYTNYSRALNATGRPIIFSLCNWGDEDVAEWGHEVGQMLRVQADHLPFWHIKAGGAGSGFGQGVGDIIEFMATLPPSKYSRPYGWLDPDFLETLFPLTMSYDDSKTEVSFWSLWSAPLIVATDVRNMDKDKHSLLMNPEVIAVDQDPDGVGGDRVYVDASTGYQVWSKPLHGGDMAVILYNPANLHPVTAKVTWQQIGWPQGSRVAVRDLWERRDMGSYGDEGLEYVLGSHQVFFFRASKLQ